MNLNQTILDAARDEVAIKHADDWEQRVSGYTHWVERYSPGEKRLLAVEKEAALLSMEKQAEFFRHIFFIGWKVVDSIDGEPIYEQGKQGPQQTELELYEIWKGVN